MKQLSFFVLFLFIIVQSTQGQNKLRHSIYGEAGGATFNYGVGYELAWLNKDKVSLQTSIGYGINWIKSYFVVFRTDVSFLKFNHFQMNFGAGYSLSETYGPNHFLNLHIGPEILLFKQHISLHPYFMSGINWGWSQGSGPPYKEKEYYPFWGGFRLKYTFPKRDKT